jgi:hypothetical protein
MTETSHGRLLVHDLVSKRNLATVTDRDLGCELLARLRRRPSFPSHVEREEYWVLLDALGHEAAALCEVIDNRFSTAFVAGQFQFVQHGWRHHGVPLRDGVHIEIGCGPVNPFGRMFTHL